LIAHTVLDEEARREDGKEKELSEGRKRKGKEKKREGEREVKEKRKE